MSEDSGLIFERLEAKLKPRRFISRGHSDRWCSSSYFLVTGIFFNMIVEIFAPIASIEHCVCTLCETENSPLL